MEFGIAVLGLDHWYTAFGVLDICFNSADTPLISVYDADANRRAEVTAAYPGVLVTDNLEHALAVPGVELAAICARTGDAVVLAQTALNAGKHVISVKPFARTESEADTVLQKAAASGKFFGSFEGMQRLHPRAILLRQLLQSGVIGPVVAFHQVQHGGLPAPWRGAKAGEPSWWLDREQVPGGAWIDHAIYAIDLARFALDGEITGTRGVMANRVHKSLPVEDYGAVTFDLISTNGDQSTLFITDTWCAEPDCGYNDYRFLGTLGTVSAEGYNSWTVQTAAGNVKHTAESGPFFRFDRLARLIQDGEAIPFGPDEARANLLACLQAYEKAL